MIEKCECWYSGTDNCAGEMWQCDECDTFLCAKHRKDEQGEPVCPVCEERRQDATMNNPPQDEGDNVKQPYIRFEYDLDFWGGDYSDVGDFAYVPAKRCEKIGYERAFTEQTGIDAQHLIHYSPDELYDADGEFWHD